ncbi:hypothetical protein BH10ACI2_BH10ACI2_01410 [soil metagenome]
MSDANGTLGKQKEFFASLKATNIRGLVIAHFQ